MRIGSKLAVLGIFLLAAILSVVVANTSARVIETRSKTEVLRIVNLEGHEWVKVQADGLRLTLGGTAPDEATRFKVLRAAASVVAPDRLIDEITVPDPDAIVPPRFSVEILRNDQGVSLIGLVPSSTRDGQITKSVERIAHASHVTDMLERADYPKPEGWDAALDYGLKALAMLPRSKISVSAGAVSITAISDSRDQKRKLESDLARAKPDSVSVTLDITAPRPVITPFTLRFLIGEDGIRFDACSADTEEARDRILAAARGVGLVGQASCTIGLGVPTPNWADGVEIAVRKLAEIGGGSITFSDADVALVAMDSTPHALFDRVVGELEAELPDVFSLKAVLPEPVRVDGTGENPEISEFVATLSPEGLMQLRGRIRDERTRDAITSFAQARFGADEVYSAARLDETLQSGWALRVLAGLEALSHLSRGSLVVQPEFVELRGETGNPDARETVSRILSDKLGAEANFALDITYVEALDPVVALPTPEECVAGVNAVLESTKIAFAPGSAEIAAGGFATLDKIANALEECAEVPMEIAGHTDSQGREVMNLNLSQARADAVLNGLMARDVLTTNLTARGYGETRPIADNDTEEGREANRRIEFTLIRDKAEEQAATEDGEEANQEAATQTGETASE
ncbi:MAG: OmpA family protein [Brevirhabdus sp.]